MIKKIEQRKAFLRQAIELAKEGLASGNPPFASILVVDEEIRAKAFNTSKTENNFLQHAEINLLMKARDMLSPDEIRRSTLYTSCEPCPMCSGAIYWSGVRSVVYGSSQNTLTQLRNFGLNLSCQDVMKRGSEKVKVIGPILENEVIPLFKKFYRTPSI